MDEAVKSWPFAEALYPFWFGEPTMHPQFEELFEYICRENPSVGGGAFRAIYLNTNGSHEPGISAHIVRCLVDSCTESVVNYSIDAVSEETYKTIRRGGEYSRVINSVREALRARGDNEWPRLVVQMVVMEENFEEAIAFRDFWRDIFHEHDREVKVLALEELDHLSVRAAGTDVISLRPLLPTGNFEKDLQLRHLWDKAARICGAEDIEPVKAILDSESRQGIVKSEVTSLSIERPRILSFEKTGKDQRRSPCPLVFSNAIVRWDGMVIPCCRNVPVFGDAAELGIRGALNSDFAGELREAALRLDMGSVEPFCGRCTDRDGEWLDFIDPGSIIAFCQSRPDSEELLQLIGSMVIRDSSTRSISDRARTHGGDLLMALGWFEDAASVLAGLKPGFERDGRIAFSFYRCESWKRASEHYLSIPDVLMPPKMLKTAGHAHLMAGRHDIARRLFSSLEKGKDWDWAWETLAERLSGTGRYDSALEAYLKIDETSRTPEVWMAIAGLYEKRDDGFQAAKSFIKAAELKPEGICKTTAVDLAGYHGLKNSYVPMMEYYIDNAEGPGRLRALIYNSLGRKDLAAQEWENCMEDRQELSAGDKLQAIVLFNDLGQMEKVLRYTDIIPEEELPLTDRRRLKTIRAEAFEALNLWHQAGVEWQELDPERAASDFERAGMIDQAASIYSCMETVQGWTGYVRCSLQLDGKPSEMCELLIKAEDKRLTELKYSAIAEDDTSIAEETFIDQQLSEIRALKARCYAAMGLWDSCLELDIGEEGDSSLRLLRLRAYINARGADESPEVLKGVFSGRISIFLDKEDGPEALEASLLALWFYSKEGESSPLNSDDREVLSKALVIAEKSALNGDVRAKLALARYYVVGDKCDKAARVLTECNDLEATELKAVIAEKKGDWIAAEGWWRAVIALSPGRLSARSAWRFAREKCMDAEKIKMVSESSNDQRLKTLRKEKAELNSQGRGSQEVNDHKIELSDSESIVNESIVKETIVNETIMNETIMNESTHEAFETSIRTGLKEHICRLSKDIECPEAFANLVFSLLPTSERCERSCMVTAQHIAKINLDGSAAFAALASEKLNSPDLAAQSGCFFREAHIPEEAVKLLRAALIKWPSHKECLFQLQHALRESGASEESDRIAFMIRTLEKMSLEVECSGKSVANNDH